MDNKLENLNDNSRGWGGSRKNAGRPEGSENEETRKKRVVEKEFKERILKSADNLLNSQMNLAAGVQMLYCIEKDEYGKNMKPRLVETQTEIEKYLENDYDKSKEYYFITTERPDNRALDSLFDRVFGRAIQPTEDLTPDKVKKITLEVINSKNGTKNTDNEIGDGKSEQPDENNSQRGVKS